MYRTMKRAGCYGIITWILINNSSHEPYTSAIQSYFKKPWFYITEIIKLMYIFSLTAEQQSGVSAWGARQQWTDPIGNGAGAGPHHPGAAPQQGRRGGPSDSSSSSLSTLPRVRYILSGWRGESGP